MRANQQEVTPRKCTLRFALQKSVCMCVYVM